MKWHIRALLALLIALIMAACGEDTGPQVNPADDYCNQTYVSTIDGRQVPPVGCE